MKTNMALTRAAALVRKGFLKGKLNDGQGNFCALGALCEAYGHKLTAHQTDLARSFLMNKGFTWAQLDSLVRTNDAATSTKETASAALLSLRK